MVSRPRMAELKENVANAVWAQKGSFIGTSGADWSIKVRAHGAFVSPPYEIPSRPFTGVLTGQSRTLDY